VDAMTYEEFRKKIVNLQADWGLFQIEFINKDSFKDFADHLFDNLSNGCFDEVCVTGYFSETIREQLERFSKMQGHKVRLICQELDPRKPREMKNLGVLRKLCKVGVEVKVNNRIHARFLVAHILGQNETFGLLVIGSFDFNTECIGRERLDAGIKTKHPDLVKSALELFDEIWNTTESIPLGEMYPIRT
jgi:hypothetical protein